MTSNPPGYLSKVDVAARFGVQPSSVGRWVHRGHLTAERFEGRLWIPVAGIEHFTPPFARSRKWPKPPVDPAIEWLTRYQWAQGWSDRRMGAALGTSATTWNLLKNRRQRLLWKRAQVRERFPEAFADETEAPM